MTTLKSRFEPLFDGIFDTGTYPDEWYGRTGMSLPLMTKQMCGAYKCDLSIAHIVLSSQLHSVTAQLNNWNGSRIAQDNLLWKPNNGGAAVGFHQDSEYISCQFNPMNNNSITCWLPLDDVSLSKGCVEYVKGSHLWNNIDPEAVITTEPGGFHSGNSQIDDGHRIGFIQMERKLKLRDDKEKDNDLEFACIEIPEGGVAFHHQNTWHGSGLNVTDHTRRVIAIHTLNSECKFRLDKEYIGYIYGKYVKYIDDGNGEIKRSEELDESFYPICWSKDEYRSRWLDEYCKNEPILYRD